MTIKIIAIGKIKEKFYREALSEYGKRLSSYCKWEIIEVADEKTKEEASETEVLQVLEKEGERILSKIPDRAFVIALAILGKELDSVAFAKYLEKQALHGESEFYFVIGGSLGLAPSVLSRANCSLSFSAMTFPHQLMQVILLEQIDRAFRISAGEPYHK